ncbi:TRAP transporter small permease [Thioclava sp. GXIMD4216]|uniref:TRAP transporter small permease n=1 Tax=Thioclava sp. GXIMD4216 TaxID=3131929 RepID=UPI0030D1B36A
MRALFKTLDLVGGLLVAALVTITFAAVIARYALGAPLQWTEEMSGILMIWIVFLGAIGCEIERRHLCIDIVTLLLPERVQKVIASLVALASVVLLGAMAWLSYKLAESAALKKTQILKISWFWLDIAVTVGALGIALVIAYRLLRGWTMERDEDDALRE